MTNTTLCILNIQYTFLLFGYFNRLVHLSVEFNCLTNELYGTPFQGGVHAYSRLSKPIQINASQFKSMQVNSSQFKSMQVNSSQFKSMRVNSNLLRRTQVYSSLFKPIQGYSNLLYACIFKSTQAYLPKLPYDYLGIPGLLSMIDGIVEYSVLYDRKYRHRVIYDMGYLIMIGVNTIGTKIIGLVFEMDK
ncbi:hypothetical protein BCR42DRAFT_395221 [Absidia repens]|uniref:Uncharacterized protein n=1 Tax=Absidia repens TaxID=90262 RepID=A0A1X2I8G4_9FUNG|nr:hypothetical protein BCR42DRAFT_395221 [Absidia repens]